MASEGTEVETQERRKDTGETGQVWRNELEKSLSPAEPPLQAPQRCCNIKNRAASDLAGGAALEQLSL